MNLADALRKTGGVPADRPLLSETASVTETHEAPVVSTEPVVSTTGETVQLPAPTSPHVASGNVVRLELFLSAEQMGGLFRAIMAGQHSVMTVREAASYLRISQDSLLKLAEEGEIPGVVIDGRWRFPKPSLDDWLTMQSTTHEEVEDVA